ncbi:hypothetical protein MDIS_02720 [Mesomycoplasma dispar]|nr:hypothetical protein MDIS_02720 [Mesomycoplasma dispar]
MSNVFFFFLMIFSTSNSIGIIFLLFFDNLVLYDKFYQIRFTLKHKIFNIPEIIFPNRINNVKLN